VAINPTATLNPLPCSGLVCSGCPAAVCDWPRAASRQQRQQGILTAAAGRPVGPSGARGTCSAANRFTFTRRYNQQRLVGGCLPKALPHPPLIVRLAFLHPALMTLTPLQPFLRPFPFQDALSLCDAEVAEAFKAALLAPHGSKLARTATAAAGEGQAELRSISLGDSSTGDLTSWADAFAALHVSNRPLLASPLLPVGELQAHRACLMPCRLLYGADPCVHPHARLN